MTSGAVGDRAVISGEAAAILLEHLLPANAKSELIHRGIVGEQLDAAITAVIVLREAADFWLQSAISANGNAEGLSVQRAPESAVWITSGEAAEILQLTDRRVRQLGDEGILDSRERGGYRQFRVSEVLALRRRRKEADERAAA